MYAQASGRAGPGSGPPVVISIKVRREPLAGQTFQQLASDVMGQVDRAVARLAVASPGLRPVVHCRAVIKGCVHIILVVHCQQRVGQQAAADAGGSAGAAATAAGEVQPAAAAAAVEGGVSDRDAAQTVIQALLTALD
jgi:hypothetical protein